jgi:hypothetical protein
MIATRFFVLLICVVKAIAFIFLVSGCIHSTKGTVLKEFQYVHNFPVRAFKENDTVKILNFRDTTSIYSMGSYVLYKLPPTVQFETNQNISGTEPFLIYKKGVEGFGYYFNSIQDSSGGVKVKVDSFLAKKGLRGGDFDIPSDSAWRLVAKDSDNATREVVEKYALIKEANETTFDSIFYYYSKAMQKVDFSFSKKLDSLKAMKLCRIRFLYKERFSQEEQFIIPKREFLFDLKDVTPKNTRSGQKLLDHFKSLARI